MTREEALQAIKAKMDYYESDKRLRGALETLIPELAENENERIRKDIIQFFRDASNSKTRVINSNTFAEWAEYLEKQREQKSAEWSDDKFPKDIEADAVQFCFDNGINITPYQAKQIATHYLMVGHNEGYVEGRKNAHIPAKELGLPSSLDFKQELSEKEIEHLYTIARYIKSSGYEDDGEFLEGVVDKLKSFRSSWKPSEEEMKALKECGECKRCIKKLYEDLQKRYGTC
jgi:hypothetical protein